MTGNGSPWVVVRIAGEALAEAAHWPRLLAEIAAARERGERVMVVCAPLPGLESEALLAAVVEGGHEPVLRDLPARLERLGVPLDEPPPQGTQELIGELGRLLAGANLLGEAGPRARARIGAMAGALPVPLLAAWLRKMGIDAAAVDPRELLAAVDDKDRGSGSGKHASGGWAGGDEGERAVLAADLAEQAPAGLGERLAALPAVVVTAGGAARGTGDDASPVLVEGGADRAAACLAAQLSALRYEAWGTSPGLFTADPQVVPSARLLRSLAYEEAIELFTTGTRGFHPRAVGPLRRAGIPLRFRDAAAPDAVGTEVSAQGGGATPRVKAVAFRSGVMLLSLETAGMWQRVGFLGEVFARIARHGLSVDLVSTAEANVTVSFDAAPGPVDGERLQRLAAELSELGRPRILGPCAAVTLVGRQIRSILHRLGPLLEAFEEQPVHLLTQAATDLNLTFVVDEEQAVRLVRELHELLLRRQGEDELLGPTWQELRGDARRGEAGAEPTAEPAVWWRRKREALLAMAEETAPVYAYDRESLAAAAAQLASLEVLDRVLYSVKANPHSGVLRTFHDAGLGFECVSPGEVAHLFALFPDLAPERILFTPNFAPRAEYDDAFARGVRVTLDNLWPLVRWPDTFAGRELFLRLDPGRGRGHHRHVRTAGTHSKFGIPLAELDETAAAVHAIGARVVGLHAHVGSGIVDPDAWREVAARLLQAAERFPDVEVLDLGGGLGVGELPQDPPLDLARLAAGLAEVKAAFPRYRLWLEPGRFLVARAGVLLARVTQLKGKGDSLYVGIETGMNSLIRPALYGAYHEIVNLTRLDEPPQQLADVVGPICESGDVLGAERRLPATEEGDVLLIANAGAYGRAMSSWYNLREPAAERLLE
ncbi:MAG TPA: bifunctional aspartate kinase/diaminopimelate decarboxylase [Thermoanaerobaculia bacterium]|jgi:diaminopimelate decarboxylase/aspartate kinase|nr:bifunctional aspartate kinase/diaminopimelate decarboxylase [Thermoanaerobaculia bacterium]